MTTTRMTEGASRTTIVARPVTPVVCRGREGAPLDGTGRVAPLTPTVAAEPPEETSDPPEDSHEGTQHGDERDVIHLLTLPTRRGGVYDDVDGLTLLDPSILASRPSPGPSPPERMVLALFDAEAPAADGAFALVGRRPPCRVPADDRRVSPLFFSVGVEGEESRVVVS